MKTHFRFLQFGEAEITGGTKVKWIQLWAGGPKFAEYNVGATSATEVGTPMTFTDATTTSYWGSNWCTPSKDEMDELLKAAQGNSNAKIKCEYTETPPYGFKFTGKETSYTGNSVFFPALDGGSSYGGAFYWSGAASGGLAWYMNLYYSLGDWDSGWDENTQNYEYLVRPVLKN